MADYVLVFISHTSAMDKFPPGSTFVEGADAAINAIDRAKAFHMAYFPAADKTPADYSISKLSEADLFVSIIGFDFGSRVRGDPGRSYTELEFDAATQLGLPRLVFLLRPEAIQLQELSMTVVRPAQLEFRRKLEESGATVAYFDSVADLKYQVQAAVVQWMEDYKERPEPGVVETPHRARRFAWRSPGGSRRFWPIVGFVCVLFLVAGFVFWRSLPVSGSSANGSGANGSSASEHGTFSGEESFKHFGVQVTDVRDVPSGSGSTHRYNLFVRVCITSPTIDAREGRTRISWDPWTLTLTDGRTVSPDTGAPAEPGMLPKAKYYETGSCPEGSIPFEVAGADVPVATVVYRNKQGDVATFARH